MYQITFFIVAWDWWSRHPPVGLWIGILGLLGVLVPLIRKVDEMGKREKALWTFVMFALLLLEIKSVYQDRNEHDKAEREARQRSEENFKSIANGITATIAATEKQFEATMSEEETILETTQAAAKLTEKNLENVTGANSVGYIVPQWDGTFVLHNEGSSILSGVSISIRHRITNVIYQSGALGTVSPGGFVPLPEVHIPPLDFTHDLDGLTVFITTQSGFFAEVITFRKGSGGFPFAYMLQVTKHIELCRPEKHPNLPSTIDCPHGISEERLVYARTWTDEPYVSWPQLKKKLHVK